MKSVLIRTGVIVASLTLIPPTSGAQQGLLGKVKDAAKKSSLGKGATRIGLEAMLLDGTTVNLDDRNLSVVPVDDLKLGISAVDLKNGEAVRLKLYLFNSTSKDVTTPLPPADIFSLVDDKGRKLDAFGDPEIKDLQEGATEVTVPAKERIEVSLLYGSVPVNARVGTLKVGSMGMISNIPLNTAAAQPKKPATDTMAAKKKDGAKPDAPKTPWKH
jgi:hypothetical protein